MAVDTNTYTYDPSRVSCIIGSHIVSGYGQGSFITAERNTQRFTRQAGASGEQTRTKSLDSSGMITLILTQGSQSHNILSGFTALQDASSGNADLFPFIIKDLNGSSLVTAEIAWVQGPPSLVFGQESQAREWKIETGNLQLFVGGLTPAVVP